MTEPTQSQVLSIPCPKCGAAAGHFCTQDQQLHTSRTLLAMAEPADPEEPKWFVEAFMEGPFGPLSQRSTLTTNAQAFELARTLHNRSRALQINKIEVKRWEG